MTLSSASNRNYLSPNSRDNMYTDQNNSQVQIKLYQILQILEPILLNDENVLKALQTGLIDTLSEMIIFQSKNLQTIQSNINGLNSNLDAVSLPQYLKVLIRCLTSMLRSDSTIDRLLSHTQCRPLMALTQIMKYAHEEEIVANSLKIIRYSLKTEQVSRPPLFIFSF